MKIVKHEKINSKLKLALLAFTSPKEDGFTMALVICLGLIFSLLAIAGIMSSARSKIDSAIHEDIVQAQAVTDLAITRYQAFLLDNPAVATYPDCATSRNSSGVCQDTIEASWSQPTNINELSTNSCGTFSVNSTVATAVSAAATLDWQDVDPSHPSKGQYRLISYTYSPTAGVTPGTGTLTVEGRVHQQGTGTSATTQGNTSTMRIQVSFPLTATTSSGSGQGPGLWAKDFSLNGSSWTYANVHDGSGIDCDSDGNPDYDSHPTDQVSTLPQLPMALTAPYPMTGNTGTIEYSTEDFPSMPGGTYSNQFSSYNSLSPNPVNEVSTLLDAAGSAIEFSDGCIHSSSKTDITYPRLGHKYIDSAGNLQTYSSSSDQGTFIYRFTDNCGGKSIAFSSDGGLVLGTNVNQKFILFLDGHLNTTNTGGVRAYNNGSDSSTVIFYVKNGGEVRITNGGDVTAPEKLQLYKYGNDIITLTNKGDIRGFVFAPEAEVKLTNEGDIVGALWTHKYTTSHSGAAVYEGIDDFSNLELNLSGGSSNQIGAIASWERQKIN